jgi:hypothetical protein
VPGIDIPNTHELGRGAGAVLRGSAPTSEVYIGQLKTFGVTDVLIFKNPASAKKDEVADEVQRLKEAGYADARVRNIPFKWTGLGPFQQTCEQTVDALSYLRDVYDTPKRAVFFHCTVGEDRTGYLAGLFRMLVDGWPVEQAFQQEMCRNGYEAGDPHKPAQVVNQIRAELTPAYLRMAFLISNGMLTAKRLDKSACSAEPMIREQPLAERFKCRRPK